MFSIQVIVGLAATAAGLALLLAGVMLRARLLNAMNGPECEGDRFTRPSDIWRLVPTTQNQWIRDDIVLRRGTYLVGRSPKSDVVLDCRFVSREHVSMKVGGGWLAIPAGESHSPVFVSCAGESRFRKLGSQSGFRFDTGDMLAFNSPEGGMVFQVLPQLPDDSDLTR